MTDDLYPVIPKAKRRPLGSRWGRNNPDADAFREIQARPEQTTPDPAEASKLTDAERETLLAAMHNWVDVEDADQEVIATVEGIIAARRAAQLVGR